MIMSFICWKSKAACRVIRRSKVRSGRLWLSPCCFSRARWCLLISLHVARFWSFQRDGASLSSLFLVRSTVDLPPHCSPRSWKSPQLFLSQPQAFQKGHFGIRFSPLGTFAHVETSGFRCRTQKPCTRLRSCRKHTVVSRTCSSQYLKNNLQN